MKIIIVFVFLLILCMISSLASNHQKRIEYSFSYEILNPKEPYGNWKSSDISFFHKINDKFTYFVGISGFYRNQGNSILLRNGIYKDWSDNLYTFTYFSYGSKSDYLPKFVFHNDFNFKTGKNKNLVLSVGVSFIKYYTINQDFIISSGLTYYQKGWNLTYKHFINKSDPGNIKSSSNLISFGIGEEKKSWIYVDFSYGKQAYLATYLANPLEVRQNSFYTSIKYRKWITLNSGYFTDLNYLDLQDSYKKYGFTIGFFKEF
ncbi:MAG: YaiO family outer membrane beta-barrel protein [bacterium]